MPSLRQIIHEASGGVAVAMAEQYRIGLFQERQTWEKERIFKADVHCSSSSPRSIARPRLPRNPCCLMHLPKLLHSMAGFQSDSGGRSGNQPCCTEERINQLSCSK